MEPRRRKRLVGLVLIALLAGGLVYALVFHPGPDLRPQVEAYLRACDADQVSEAVARTGLGQTWSLPDLMESARFRRGILGRFESIESVEPLERMAESGPPGRRLRAQLRFAKLKQPLACTFEFARGEEGWLLANLDIPLPEGRGLAGSPDRARADAEAIARLVGSAKFESAYDALARETRKTLSSEAFSERMQTLVDGLGALTEVRCQACEPMGRGMLARVQAHYDTGITRLIELRLVQEYGHWRATSIEVREP